MPPRASSTGHWSTSAWPRSSPRAPPRGGWPRSARRAGWPRPSATSTTRGATASWASAGCWEPSTTVPWATCRCRRSRSPTRGTPTPPFPPARASGSTPRPSSARCRSARSLVRQHADDDAVRIANEEAADAPGLVDRAVDDLVPGLQRLGMRRIDGRPRADVHAHVGQRGLDAGRREEDLGLAGSEADVPAAEAALLEAEHLRVERARGLDVHRLVVGHDAPDGHADGVS